METIKQKPTSKAETAYCILLAKLKKMQSEKQKEKAKEKEKQKQQEREEYLCK
jgi:hypothetical protein